MPGYAAKCSAEPGAAPGREQTADLLFSGLTPAGLLLGIERRAGLRQTGIRR